MAPFRDFLKPSTKFVGTNEHQEAFEASKQEIIEQIQTGVEIFDKGRTICIATDWSKSGSGCFNATAHAPNESYFAARRAGGSLLSGLGLLMRPSLDTQPSRESLRPSNAVATSYRSLHRSRPQAPGPNIWRPSPGRHQQRQVAQLEREDPPIFIQDGVYPRRAQLHVGCSVSPSFQSIQSPRDVPAGRSFSTTTPYPPTTDGRALRCHHGRDEQE